MGCYKIDKESAWFVCPCGLDSKFKISDLEYDTATIILPECVECGRRSSLFVNEISKEEEETFSEGYLLRNVLNQTLFQRFLKYDKKPMFGNSIPKDDITRLVSDEEVVEAPLHPKIAEAKRIREES